jgi:CBS domain containing-hemolysin-like protein
MNVWSFVLLLVLLLVNALAVAAEYAFVRMRRTRVDELVQRGTPGAASTQRVTGALDRYIAATQVVITMAGLGLGFVGEPALSALLEPVIGLPLAALDEGVRRSISAVVSLVIVTGITVVVSEIVPKNLAIRYTERAALALSGPIELLELLFRPLVWLINAAAGLVLRLLGIRNALSDTDLYSVPELRMLVDASEEGGVIEQTEAKMVNAVFDFGDSTAREVMVPRTEMQAVEADATIQDLRDLAAQQPRSRFPVYEGDLDHIIGIAHVKDLVKFNTEQRRATPVRAIMREAMVVPDALKLDRLLQQMRTKRQHIAIVLDEYGGTAGLVTLGDLMEQIVGEVQDTFDTAGPEIRPLPDGSYLVEGLTLIETVNERLGLKLSDDYYDTIAGYALGRLGRVPRIGDTIEGDEGVRLKVEALDGLRIARVILVRPPGEDE